MKLTNIKSHLRRKSKGGKTRIRQHKRKLSATGTRHIQQEREHARQAALERDYEAQYAGATVKSPAPEKYKKVR